MTSFYAVPNIFCVTQLTAEQQKHIVSDCCFYGVFVSYYISVKVLGNLLIFI